MRIAVASTFGCALSWWKRLADEGNDVKVWIDPKSGNKSVGDGIVGKLTSWEKLVDWVKTGRQSGIQTIVLFDSSGIGDKADDLRRMGIPVVGGGTFCDRLEKDRVFGQKIAAEVGCPIPAYQEFSSITDAMAACKNIKDGVFFKTDRYISTDATHGASSGEEMHEYLRGLIRQSGGHGKCILQEKIKGVPLSTARWWNGMSFVGPYEGVYENKKLMNDDVGPSTGCSFNVGWFYESELPVPAELLGFEALADVFRKNNAPPGIYDINAIIDSEGTAWFLEWTPRLGYASEMTMFRLLPNLGEFLHGVATAGPLPGFYDSLAYSLTIGIPPYPWEFGERTQKGSPDGTLIEGLDGLWDKQFIPYCIRKQDDDYVVAGHEGLLGLSFAAGEDIESIASAALDYAREIRAPGTMFRTDGGKDVAAAAEKLSRAGIDVHPGLLS